MFHCCPRALSIGSLSRSRFLIVLSSAGWNLVGRKFPLRNILISSNDECTACSVDGFENKLSST